MEILELLLWTFFGFFISNLGFVFTRQRKSSRSPVKFDIVFFIRDNWQKMLVSMIMSFSLTIGFWKFMPDIIQGTEFKLWYAVAIGAVPDVWLNIMKNSFGLFKPQTVEDSKGNKFERK